MLYKHKQLLMKEEVMSLSCQWRKTKSQQSVNCFYFLIIFSFLMERQCIKRTNLTIDTQTHAEHLHTKIHVYTFRIHSSCKINFKNKPNRFVLFYQGTVFISLLFYFSFRRLLLLISSKNYYALLLQSCFQYFLIIVICRHRYIENFTFLVAINRKREQISEKRKYYLFTYLIIYNVDVLCLSCDIYRKING